jgi:hypothetical protein
MRSKSNVNVMSVFHTMMSVVVNATYSRTKKRTSQMKKMKMTKMTKMTKKVKKTMALNTLRMSAFSFRLSK